MTRYLVGIFFGESASGWPPRHPVSPATCAAVAQACKPAVAGLLEQAAADGKTVRGAVRPDGSQVHLLSVFHVGQGCTLAQREVGAKTNEIPELAPCIEGLDLTGMVVTVDALHTQRETARLIPRTSRGATT